MQAPPCTVLSDIQYASPNVTSPTLLKDESAVECDGLRPAAQRKEGGGNGSGLLDEVDDLEGATDVAGGKLHRSDSPFQGAFNGGVTTKL